jgi:hypothetical protein
MILDVCALQKTAKIAEFEDAGTKKESRPENCVPDLLFSLERSNSSSPRNEHLRIRK